MATTRRMKGFLEGLEGKGTSQREPFVCRPKSLRQLSCAEKEGYFSLLGGVCVWRDRMEKTGLTS